MENIINENKTINNNLNIVNKNYKNLKIKKDETENKLNEEIIKLNKKIGDNVTIELNTLSKENKTIKNKLNILNIN